MIKISDAVSVLVDGSAFLRFGLYHRLLNLAQVARFVRPMIEGRTQKPVQISAISMALSRFQNEMNDEPTIVRDFRLQRINLHAGLCVLTFPKAESTQSDLNSVYSRLNKEGAYITMTEGTIEVTMIFDQRYLPIVLKVMRTPPVGRHDHVSGLGVRFDPRYEDTPGLIYELLQQLAIQRINVVELASTRTELNIYLREVDVRLAFDSLYAQFVERKAKSPWAPSFSPQ